MLSRDNIVFEYDVLAHAHTVSQDIVKDELVTLINDLLNELQIIRLDQVVVKETKFFETELGIANYENYTIVLANRIAYHLADKSNRFYQSSLAVLMHELYHFLDYQNLLLNCARKQIPQLSAAVLNDYRCWTEFFASYSIFEVCEDENLYTSFESVFAKGYSTDKDKKYYTCRLFGYYLHGGHSERCDKLVAKYLSKNALEKATSSFQSILQNYPQYSTEQLRNIGLAISEVIDKQDDIANYTPISTKDFWQRMLDQSKKSNL